jgi:cytidylate kinase
MTRVITISRQYGSGGGEIARRLAVRLGWRLLDRPALEEVAARAQVSPAVAQQFDERVDPWFHRMVKALWQGGYEGAASTVENTAFDSETMARLWEKIILEAAAIGEAVVVGRGAQCVLSRQEEAFHVSIYAPRKLRVLNLAERLPKGTNLEALMAEKDQERAAYIRNYFNRDWTDRRLYHLMICSSVGFDTAVQTILTAAGLAPQTIS